MCSVPIKRDGNAEIVFGTNNESGDVALLTVGYDHKTGGQIIGDDTLLGALVAGACLDHTSGRGSRHAPVPSRGVGRRLLPRVRWC